ncbi:acyl-CoA carboxylase subunit epsilon [Kribbella sp. NBC_01245]|uniref:acyl-CoA carboxylase subunit epsilon n=1 Tax=Kribbella sp. NBC_01245 TaxID=2903578 RepID=UPI002E28FEF5|nr:acyl-CoA carboxylase subunit epsilon [Kribbella sp. NBC_01245]
MTEETKPVLQVVKGEPTPEELAALVAVVAARASTASTPGPATDDERSSDWASYWRNVRRPLQHGPGRWRASAHP